ncbi:hypothetical protein TEA_026879 [Camellia sinensis var. sinensis]|uniref:Uncharacterized protein n=1 Tax=Camellia sinensis var. sinensis TaxID=542762 RepID=A0A4S4D4C4_CAMSN|nr:hypothetical protein TEA_026879 [Camellia sinensis var. sinensis]
MPRSRFAGSLMSPKVDLMIDMGNPFLNLTVDGFLKIGTVAVAKAAAEETYDIFKSGFLIFYVFILHEIRLGGALVDMKRMRTWMDKHGGLENDKSWWTKTKTLETYLGSLGEDKNWWT